ncbi:AMP-binding protein [Syntrophomonas palmitatica]|uniref:AMP-binding protein n=1 Tax=Syntrophomonas palmitatica TaxID=402877 RepID=UPI0006D280C9|nr:AMP-binding protein [Syntrophomonas palmitatica]
MNKNLLELFDEQVHTIPGALYNTQTNYGNRPANILKEEGKWRIVTYNEMISRVEKLAIGLIRLGLSPEDRVGIKGNTSARWTWADLGTLFAGAATVSLYPNLNRAETTAVVKHSNVKLLFVDNQQRLDEINSYRSDMPSLQYLVCLQKGFRGNGQDVFSLGELIRLGSTDYTAGLVLLKNRLKSLRADSPAAVVYTSGTVGA